MVNSTTLFISAIDFLSMKILEKGHKHFSNKSATQPKWELRSLAMIKGATVVALTVIIAFAKSALAIENTIASLTICIVFEASKKLISWMRTKIHSSITTEYKEHKRSLMSTKCSIALNSMAAVCLTCFLGDICFVHPKNYIFLRQKKVNLFLPRPHRILFTEWPLARFLAT